MQRPWSLPGWGISPPPSLLRLQSHAGASEWAFDSDAARREKQGYAVHNVAGKGACVFATRDFAIGEELLVDLPILTWLDGVAMCKSTLAHTLSALVSELSPSARAVFDSLSYTARAGHCGESNQTGIWLTNALPSSENGGASVYEDACRLSHSWCVHTPASVEAV